MGKFIDYTGQKINNWKVIGAMDYRVRNESVWEVECDCEHKTRDINTLSSIKRRKFCSECLKEEKLNKKKESIIGTKYGKLTIVDYYGYRDDVASKSPHWIAKCDCDSKKEIIATLYDIKKGRISSCGCYINDEEYISKMRKIGSKRKYYNEYIEIEDAYKVLCRNGYFYIDKEDFEQINMLNVGFYIKDGYVYYHRQKKDFQLHRFIMNLDRYNNIDKIIVDHIDGNRNNNRKSNLRVTIKGNNPKNCDMYSNNTSGVKGVSWLERISKWQVSIQVNGENKYLGIYSKLEDAKRVRINAENEFFGEFRREINYEI